MNKQRIFKNLFSSAIILFATYAMASTPATVAYVDAADEVIKNEIESKGGTVGQLDCQKNNPPPSSDATVAYVDECDNELFAAIENLVPGSQYTVGQVLCTSSDPCLPTSLDAWGIVIFVDGNSQTTGHGGLAMALKDLSGTFQWDATPVPVFVPSTDHYGIYGGIDNTTAGDNVNRPAIKACADDTTTFDDWYLPAISELMLMFSVAEQLAYGADAKFPYNQPLDSKFFVSFTMSNYWSSTQNHGFGVSCPSGQPGCGTAADSALSFIFGGGTQGVTNKNGSFPVRCVRVFE